MFLNSSILENAEDIHQMSFWFNEGGHAWQLCYRASRDGWNAKYFHLKCQNKGPTVTLVKVDENIFGGYIDVDWQGNYYQIHVAMLTSLVVLIESGSSTTSTLIKHHKLHNTAQRYHTINEQDEFFYLFL